MTPAARADGPLRYRLLVAGHLDDHWSAWFGGLRLVHLEDGTTGIVATVRDQAELHGLLARVRDLGVTLLSVSVVEESSPGTPARP